MAEKEYIEREAAIEACCGGCNPAMCSNDCDEVAAIRKIPAADVPSALWTDEPISGTEFMTHNQGQSGFEIHFRTDEKAKYEAVQDECRRQIGHAKPAADVRPVVLCKDCKHRFMTPNGWHCPYAEWGIEDDDFCCCGEKREES